MKRSLFFGLLGLLVFGFWSLGIREAERASKELFSAGGAKSGAKLPSARSLLAAPLLAEMAMKMLPEPSRAIGKKLTLNDEEKTRRDEFLADRSNIDMAKRYLLEKKPSWDFMKARERFQVQDVLVAALADPSNPSQEYAVEKVSEFIQTDNFDRLEDRMQVTMAMGDRGYLYSALLQYHPQAAKELYESSRGTRVGMVLDAAQKKYERLTQGI